MKYHDKSKKMFGLCEENRAELFMKATKFNLDSVHTRTFIYNSNEKLIVSDLYTHSQCITNIYYNTSVICRRKWKTKMIMMEKLCRNGIRLLIV